MENCKNVKYRSSSAVSVENETDRHEEFLDINGMTESNVTLNSASTCVNIFHSLPTTRYIG